MKQLNWYQIFGKSNIPDGRTVLPTDDIQIWLHCANIWDKTYTTLAEVLADTDTLSALINSENAVDYMVRSTTWAVSVSVPTMTSATTPEGEVITSGTDGSFYPYYAFDGNNSTFWVSSDTSGTSGHVGYKFVSPVVISEFKADISQRAASAGTFKIQGSNDNATWVDLYTGSYSVSTASVFVSKSGKFSNDTAYTYYRIVRTSGSSRFMINNLQFYSASITADSTAMSYIGANNYCANTLLADATWCEAICNSEYFESVLNVKVPTMTSNTTPSGECSASTYQSSYPAWKAFDDNETTAWGASTTTFPQYVSYTFTKDVHIFKASVITTRVATLKIQALDNGTWVDLTETQSMADAVKKNIVISNNDNSYAGYKALFVTGNSAGNGAYAREVQFYGREDV